ncbi:MAG: DUF1015 domain-containing protein, partial [Deltaproteobacteria bacterium]|nr:DUF1015 domain-containing protein [Deltaproteobacteria bacterium]
MKNINPFPAWRYNTQKITDLSQVLAPPYDVIGPNKRQKLIQASDYNVVQIDLPEAPEGQDKYAKAAQIFESWKQSEVLKQDQSPALYLYFQTYTLEDGRTFTRKGFFARKKLEAFGEGSVKPHERTFEGPKADRLKLMQATSANLSAIFGLYTDPEGTSSAILTELAQGEPDIKVQWEDQVHQLWRVQEEGLIAKLLDPIQNSSVLIADGHHRYETALNYRGLRRQQLGEGATGEESFEGVLMYLCPLSDPGLIVLPTHRVLAARPSVSEEDLRQRLLGFGTLQDYSLDQVEDLMKDLEALGETRALAWIDGNRASLFVLDGEKITKSKTLSKLSQRLQK